MEWLKSLLEDKAVVYSIMAILVFGITQGLKWLFVKQWTNKLENERVRKAINTVIFFIPYFVAIGLEYLYSVVLMNATANFAVGVLTGGAGHSVYALYERLYSVITGKITSKNTKTSNETQSKFEDCLANSLCDGKVDKTEMTAVTSFWDKVNQ